MPFNASRGSTATVLVVDVDEDPPDADPPDEEPPPNPIEPPFDHVVPPPLLKVVVVVDPPVVTPPVATLFVPPETGIPHAPLPPVLIVLPLVTVVVVPGAVLILGPPVVIVLVTPPPGIPPNPPLPLDLDLELPPMVLTLVVCAGAFWSVMVLERVRVGAPRPLIIVGDPPILDALPPILVVLPPMVLTSVVCAGARWSVMVLERVRVGAPIPPPIILGVPPILDELPPIVLTLVVCPGAFIIRGPPVLKVLVVVVDGVILKDVVLPVTGGPPDFHTGGATDLPVDLDLDDPTTPPPTVLTLVVCPGAFIIRGPPVLKVLVVVVGVYGVILKDVVLPVTGGPPDLPVDLDLDDPTTPPPIVLTLVVCPGAFIIRGPPVLMVLVVVLGAVLIFGPPVVILLVEPVGPDPGIPPNPPELLTLLVEPVGPDPGIPNPPVALTLLDDELLP